MRTRRLSPRQASGIAAAAEQLWLSLKPPLCCPDWTHNNSTPPWTVRSARLCCWIHILTLQVPSPYPPLFQLFFFFNYRSLFKQRDTLGLKHILCFFPHSLLLPFSQQKSPSCAVFALCEGTSLCPSSSLPTRASNHGFYAAPCTAAKTEERRIKAAVNK